MIALTFVCPICRSVLQRTARSLRCESCGHAFTLVNDLPVLVAGELSKQQEFQRHYFDSEFVAFEDYELSSWRLSFIERIFNAIGVLDGRHPYLDVGVGGSGTTVIEAARRGIPAVGCDLSVEGVSAAARAARREGVEHETAFCVCAAEALPFRDAAFGSVSAVAVLEHLNDDGKAAAELARVVRPGGRVWITVPHAYRYIPPPLWPVYWWHDRQIGHKRHYDDRRLRDLFAAVGLEHVTTMFSGHPVKIAQFLAQAVFPSLRQARSRWWWRFENVDRRAQQRPLWALQLNAVFRRL